MTKVRLGGEPEIVCRLRPSQRLKETVLEAQEFACLGCQELLEDVELDHVVPLRLGGSNDLNNWAALCPQCHKKKTKIDLRRIAKAKRQRRYHETGRSRVAVGLGRGFDKQHRRHLNGVVVPRCQCPECRRQDFK